MVGGDLAVVDGDFAGVSGRQAVAQGAQIRVSSVAGEIWLDQAQGVNYAYILDKNADPVVVRELLREALADTPDVTEVAGQQLQVDSATRQAQITFNLATVFGAPNVTGSTDVPGGGAGTTG
jgi:hypothetical protein